MHPCRFYHWGKSEYHYHGRVLYGNCLHKQHSCVIQCHVLRRDRLRIQQSKSSLLQLGSLDQFSFRFDQVDQHRSCQIATDTCFLQEGLEQSRKCVLWIRFLQRINRVFQVEFCPIHREPICIRSRSEAIGKYRLFGH